MATTISGLRAIRRRQGLSLAQVADLAGLSRSHLSRVERGMQSLSVAAVLRLARALRLSDAELRDLLHDLAVKDKTP